jgi:phosphoribosyl 1,2-cyclic phosphodiesterase
MKIKFWGTRGSIAVPGKDTITYGGNTTCVEINLESGRKIIIDAGTGIRVLGEHLSLKKEPVEIHLLITHIHWDHVLGFPFFAPVYVASTRISIDGFPTCIKGLRYPFDNKMGDGFFPVQFDDLKADIHYLDTLNHSPLTIDETIIDRVPLNHPQGGFGFRFREGRRTLVFITDNELRGNSWARRHFEDYVAFCKDADILIHDAQYAPEEIRERRGWGHSDYTDVCDLAFSARVRRLILFHHDPSRTDSQVAAIETHCMEIGKKAGAAILIEAAKEGGTLTL